MKEITGFVATLYRRVRVVRSLPALDRWLLVSAFLRETAVRIALRLLPTRSLLRFITWRAENARASRRRCHSQPNRLLWALRIASRRVPGSTCLTRALAAQWMLARYGYGSRLRLGVARPSGAGIEAHAWVEFDGVPVVGGVQLGRYVPLPDLKSAAL